MHRSSIRIATTRDTVRKGVQGHFEVTVIYRPGEAACPRCGRVTTKKRDKGAAAQAG